MGRVSTRLNDIAVSRAPSGITNSISDGATVPSALALTPGTVVVNAGCGGHLKVPKAPLGLGSASLTEKRGQILEGGSESLIPERVRDQIIE